MSTNEKAQSLIMREEEGFAYGFVGKSFGILGLDKGPTEVVYKNRLSLSREIGIKITQVVMMYQVHGTTICDIDISDRGGGGFSIKDLVGPADGMVTQTKDVVLIVKTADCVPVLLFDPISKAVGVAHGGWQGTLHGVAGKLIQKMRDTYTSSASDLKAIIGPCIHACHYDVSTVTDNRVHEFRRTFGEDAIVRSDKGKVALDLVKANRLQLQEVGVSEIEVVDICTFEDSQWASLRRDGNCDYENWSYIHLK